MDQIKRIRKVPIEALIEQLRELYDRGVDYVDIGGMLTDGQDTISFRFYKSYMNEEYAEQFDLLAQEQLPSKIDMKLSDEDLDQLI